MVGWDSSVGMVTLMTRGLNPGGERHFPHTFRTALGPTQGPVEWVLCNLGEQSGRSVTLTINPHLAPRLQKEYRYSVIPPTRRALGDCTTVNCFTTAKNPNVQDSWSHTHTQLGRNPLDEWSDRRRYLYLTTHNTQNREISMPKAGLELINPASKRSQTHARWTLLQS
jgi:hypothetical protein